MDLKNIIPLSKSYSNIFKNNDLFLLINTYLNSNKNIVFVSEDKNHSIQLKNALRFFLPNDLILFFPGWDCLPYDKISPTKEVLSTRANILSLLLKCNKKRYILLTTVDSIMQRTTPKEFFKDKSLCIKKSSKINLNKLSEDLSYLGFEHVDPVRQVGEFAIRGGIVDIYYSNENLPVRIDLFDDEVESIKLFDPVNQTNTSTYLDKVNIKTIKEIFLTKNTVSNFRTNYRNTFNTNGDGDPLYQSISEEKTFQGQEHWLPLFYNFKTNLLSDYTNNSVWIISNEIKYLFEKQKELIFNYYLSRKEFSKNNTYDNSIYLPVKPNIMYCFWKEFLKGIDEYIFLNRSYLLEDKNTTDGKLFFDFIDFAKIRSNPKLNIYKETIKIINDLVKKNIKVIIAAQSIGSSERLINIFKDIGFYNIKYIKNIDDLSMLPSTYIAITDLYIESGVLTKDIALITEQDILGKHVIRQPKKLINADNYLDEMSQLQVGDHVIHLDYGIGIYDGLVTLEIAKVKHDCLKIKYLNNDKLFVPIESIQLLSKYGSENIKVQLDKLGGSSWQARKLKVKEKIKEIANDLIKVAAKRFSLKATKVNIKEHTFEEFKNKFPYTETEEQEKAINDVLDDLSKSVPMDRLVCGDVGFGKTEVALRGAYLAVMSGLQVAVVVPTTLLAKQHYFTFKERFNGFAVNISQLSKFVERKKAKINKENIKKGYTDIVIGTHALFAKDIEFKNLGLLIIDEEQHFGVEHKEHLKKLKSTAHVLSLTATPIPRTLQMSLAGVRTLSVISTPPVDRLAVHTLVTPYDSVVVREALLREHKRGGQTFFVCPHIKDLKKLFLQLEELVPELKIAIVHGRVAPKTLEKSMNEFLGGFYDVLLSTNIIESGIDIPRANSILIYNSHMFGLSQLHQMRGRVGRSKIQAYAYFFTPVNSMLNTTASKRLEVLKRLDYIGAGFSIASYDLDIRGAGNILGKEQHGNIKEVGVELYQHMLEEAVAEAKGIYDNSKDYEPSINLGIPILIPENYVSNLDVRMSLYRKISNIDSEEELNSLASNLIDRFGAPLPHEIENLLQTILIKKLCKKSNVEKLEVGDKGFLVSFYKNIFLKPENLLNYIQEKYFVTLNNKQQLLYNFQTTSNKERIDKCKLILLDLIKLAS